MEVLRLENDEKYQNYPQLIAWAETKDGFYFHAYNMAGLFFLNKETEKLEIKNADKPLLNWRIYAYRDVVKYKNRLVFIPYQSRYFEIYNLDDNTLKFVDKGNDIPYSKGVVVGKKIVVIPEDGNLNRTLYLSMEDWSVGKYNCFTDMDIRIRCSSKLVEKDNWLYFPVVGESDYIVRVNFEISIIEKIHIPMVKKEEISMIVMAGTSFFLFGKMDYILVWKEDCVSKIEINKLDISSQQCAWDWKFSDAVLFKNYIYLAPLKHGSLSRINYLTNEFEDLIDVSKVGYSWDIEVFKNTLIFNLSPKSGISNMSIRIDETNKILSTAFLDFGMSADTSKYGTEISRWSLLHFIKSI